MKNAVILLLIICAAYTSLAQHVVASSGHTGSMTGFSVSWTVGEPMIETFTETNNTLTQGMHQTRLVVTAITDLQFPGFTISAFPNPAASFVNLKVEQTGSSRMRYHLNDLAGRRIAERQMTLDQEQVSLEGLAPGIYFLSVTPDNHSWTKTFKIVKK